MKTKLGQEPAFSGTFYNQDRSPDGIPGISKRFYAACAAMEGILSSRRESNLTLIDDKKLIIEIAYQYADELLKQETNE